VKLPARLLRIWARLERRREFALLRTLRFTLAATFLGMLLVILLVAGIAGTSIIRSVIETSTEDTLREELAALKGYLNLDQGIPTLKAEDEDDRAEIARLTRVYVIADADGHVKKGTTDAAFNELNDGAAIRRDVNLMRATQPQQNVFRIIKGDEDGPYKIIASIVYDDRHAAFYVAVGRTIAGDEAVLKKFRRDYLIFLALATAFAAAASWYSAGRALYPLQSVEQAAKAITGTNLGLQIPKRGANDELDRLIGTFNEMSRRLKASFDQVRQFSTDVSHELRTPLTSIQGQLEVALFTAKQPEQLREAIENALQDVERLSNLIRALLLLSQSETGQLRMNKSRLDLAELISELVEQFQIPAEAAHLKLTNQASEPVICEADRTQMERLVTNLLSNSLKYTPPGGWIRVTAANTGANVELVVEDSGLGIAHEHLSRVFERFYRVPDSSPEKGLGLGLSFVASIVRAHGGEIQVESELGKGTKFVVSLPAGAPAPQLAPMLATPEA
jgi:heavy metal sensor kinase